MPQSSIQADSPKIKWFVRVVYGVIIATLLIGGWAIVEGVRTSLKAERTLQATLVTLELLTTYVEQNENAWPSSWKDLEALPQSEYGTYAWPDDRADIEQRVYIDFQADPRELAKQKPEEFEAVKPLGSYYPWKDYQQLQNLLTTLRESQQSNAE